mgnify:FL=1
MTYIGINSSYYGLYSLCLTHAYTLQFKLGPSIVDRPYIVNAVLGRPLLDFVLFMSDIIFLKKIVLRNS